MVITNGFTYVAFLILISGGLLALQKYTGWKVFRVIPPLIWVYVLNMVFCTVGLYDSDAVRATYDGLLNNLLYAMIFIMLLQCDLRKFAKLGPKLIAIFLACSVTIGIGFIVFYPIFMESMGGGEKTWAAVTALYASWVGGTPNMAAMRTVYGDLMDMGAYSCAMAVDTVCASVWIALLLFGAKFADKWNALTKAGDSKLNEIIDATNAEITKSHKQATVADWVFLLGIAFTVSAISQQVGGIVLVMILGLICALTPLRKLPATEELSGILLYTVIAMMASQAPLNALMDAPMWVLYGFLILAVHLALMVLLSKIFHWEQSIVSIASMANIGGSASAPVVAAVYDSSLAGIAVIMGMFGAALGNFFGMGLGAILQLIA